MEINIGIEMREKNMVNGKKIKGSESKLWRDCGAGEGKSMANSAKKEKKNITEHVVKM